VPSGGRDDRYSFTRDRRLTEAKQFDEVFAARRRFTCGNLQVYARPNGTDRARLGLAINRKASGTAVLRNRLKRQARETFRQMEPPLDGIDVIVSVGRPLTPAAQRRFAIDLQALLERARTCVKR
jgi:ribonuclease P protein component